MKKRLLGSLGLLAALAVIGSFALTWLLPQHGITPDHFALLREGMTQAEVEALLGGPPGAYTTGEDWSWELENGMCPVDHTVRIWVADDGGMKLFFNPEGRLAYMHWADHQAVPFSLMDRLRRWLPF